jgi:SAM-dependent methyltransferase
MSFSSPAIPTMFQEAKIIPKEFAARYFLDGLPLEGIEIGALHSPLKVPENCQVTYVDRYSKKFLEEHYRNDDLPPLVDVDVIDEGETLSTFIGGSQDFVIATHVIEHFPDPLLALKNMWRVLRNDGILYLGAPDKRFTFDLHRPITPFEHLVRDFEQGAALSRREHVRDYFSLSCGVEEGPELEKKISEEMALEHSSFHHHVWDAKAFLNFLMRAGSYLKLNWSMEFFWHLKTDILVVLKKEDDQGVFRRNLEALEKHNPGVAKWIASVDDRELRRHYQVTPKYARGQKIAVHSEQDPLGEGRAIADAWLRAAAGREKIGVIGFGLAYHLEALLDGMREDQCLEVQLVDRVLFQAALRKKDLRRVLGDPRLTFVSHLTRETAFTLPSIQ